MSSTKSAADTAEYPRLRHCTLIGRSDDEPLRMIVGRNHFEITEELGTREQFLHIKRYFDGRHSVGEISRLTGTSERSIRGVVAAFRELGLLRQEEPQDFIPAGQFVERVQDSCVMWSRQIGYHRLFGLLREGEARREVFLGLLLETYHFVKSAPRHISTALSHCTDARWESLLSEYLAEEHGHWRLIVQTLERVGMREDWVVAAHPIIGTMSLINMLCDIGRQSTLSYLACTSLFEARREDFDAASKELEYIGAQYGCDPEALAPLITHAGMDVGAEHSAILERALEAEGRVPAREAHLAVNCLHDLKHSFDQFHDQILQYYSDVSNYIPRLKVDYFSL